MNDLLPLELLHRGKVREVYRVDENRLLLVASDRVSAFDVILPQPIPRKGEVLTQLTAWWLNRMPDQVDDHYLSVDPKVIRAAVPTLQDVDGWERRATLVHRTDPLPVECVVRGYVSGSAWKEYKTSGTLAGEPLPEGLSESEQLAQPIFSPATKATTGHDENIPFEGVVARVGVETAERLRTLSFLIYGSGADFAATKGIILADTKFEFGVDCDGRLLLIDEVLTPDSSRFWPAEAYAPGRGQPSLDKQPIRDWLDTVEGWNRTAPGPDLPPEVVRETTDRYLEIFHRLTGVHLDDYDAGPGRSS